MRVETKRVFRALGGLGHQGRQCGGAGPNVPAVPATYAQRGGWMWVGNMTICVGHIRYSCFKVISGVGSGSKLSILERILSILLYLFALFEYSLRHSLE